MTCLDHAHQLRWNPINAAAIFMAACAPAHNRIPLGDFIPRIEVF
jgi:hypothetical protein